MSRSFQKGPILHERQKKSQYEKGGTYSSIWILEIMFLKCSLPNLYAKPYGHCTDHWLYSKLIGLYGSKAADPTILQPSLIIFGKNLYRICSYTMCHYVINI